MSQSTKVLFIVRHAKSSWDYVNVSDLDRPLKERGISNAYEMARRLKIKHDLPEYLISSPAIRALHTANIFVRGFDFDFNLLKIDDKLYGGGLKAIREVINNCPEEYNRLMIFGHNPDFSEISTHFSNEGFIEMPTCCIVRFEFNTDSWNKISNDNVVSEETDFPKKES